MDTDEQQEDINDQIGQTQTELCVEQIISTDQDAACSFSQSSHNYSGNDEFHLSSIHSEDGVKDNHESHVGKIWKLEQLKEKAKNGEDMQMAAEGKEEEDFEVASEVSFLKDTSGTSSPSRNFKSSYAKSLADSYRRASLPVIVSAPKGQFYFKNEEFLSLNSSQMNISGFNQDRFFSLSSNPNKTALSQSFEPLSLPPILDVASEPEEIQAEVAKSDLKASSTNLFEQLLVDGDVFVPYERICSLCEENGGSFSLQDWHTLGSVITSDGRKLIKLSDLPVKCKKQNLDVLFQNGHMTTKGSDRDAQVESMFLEREQLEGRVEQLCEVLADRDATIQRLEEDLLRIRMECQRLLVDNRSLKSSVGHAGAQQPPGGDSPSEAAKLQQQVQLLTAQLSKAERSRHTYEAATRQLVDFLHTVNSTLNMSAGQTCTSTVNMSTNHSTGTGHAASPTTSLHSVTSPATSQSTITPTTVSSNVPPDDDGDEDPPYRLANPKTPSPDLVSSPSSHSFGPVRRNSDAVRKAGSVWALPTQSGNPRRVNRAVSTYCVASAASGPSHSNTGASLSHDRGRSLTSDFLASRARELIASLKSLMRSDSVLKLNLEPKKSGSSVKSNSSTSRSTKIEGNPAVTSVDKSNNKAITKQALVGRQNNGHGEDRQAAGSLHHDNIPWDKNQNTAVTSENNASPGVNQNFISTNNINVAPMLNNDTAREDLSQTQTVDVNSNPQPLSLLVVGESSSAHDDHRFSSLPNRSCVSRTLNDSEHRLVWV